MVRSFRSKNLSESQKEIYGVLCELYSNREDKRISVFDIMVELGKKGVTYSPNRVKSILNSMELKGFVSFNRSKGIGKLRHCWIVPIALVV